MKRGFALFCGIVLIAVAGCGGPAKSSAGGTVTYNGNPVADANVIFTPAGAGAEGKVATGRTDAQGKFSLGTDAPGDGVIPGEYNVSIVANTTAPPEGDYSIGTTKPPFPQHYSDATASGLKATIKPGDNDIPLELKD